MHIPDFELERFFARWEFTVSHNLCASDVEPLRLADLLALADDETAHAWRELSLGYTESLGGAPLRAEIARLYAAVDPDEVMTFAGAEEAIFIVVNASLERGDHAITTWPGYQSLYDVARAAGADVTLLELSPGDRWQLDPERLRAALRPDTRLVLLNFPHNPTGSLPDAQVFTALVETCEEAGVTLVSDEVYRLLEQDERDRLPAGVELGRGTASLGVLSKAYGLAGLRIGWLASHDRELLRRTTRLKDYTTICNAAPSEALGLMALRASEQLLGRSRAIISSNLAVLDRLFDAWPETLEWVRPRGGSVGFPELRLEVPVDELCAKLVEDTGVLLLPATAFGHRGNHFRIGFGRSNLPVAVERLEGWLANAR